MEKTTIESLADGICAGERHLTEPHTIKPLKIGTVTIEHPLILAPMAGVTDLPFRLLCREQGAGLLCTEMVSAKAICYKNKNTAKLMEIRGDERPVSLQLFGSEPEFIAEAIRLIEDRPYDILDFNMGCPVPKVVGNGEGSALMREPERVTAILKAMVRTSKKPVTVKIRAGFDEQHKNAVEIARIAEDAGVSAIAVHARTREQYYAGHADWEVIRQVKEAVRIPVIGNGDIKTADDVLHMREQTGCDGFMIGRGAQGNPWIFAQILHKLSTGRDAPSPSADEVRAMLLRHARMLIAVKGEYVGIREMRKHAGWYLTGFHGASALRGRICTVESYAALEALLSRMA